MADAKKGLRLLAFSIILNVGWSIAVTFIPSITDPSGKIVTFLPAITMAILIVCYIVDFAGLRIAGHNNKHFAGAWKLKIITILLALIALIIGIVAAVKENEQLYRDLSTYVMIVRIISVISEFVVFLFIIKGCREIAPRVKGLSKFTSGLFILQSLMIIAVGVLSYITVKKNIPVTEKPINIAYLICGSVFAVAAVLFAFSYILLIFRTTANVGKARKH